MTPSVLVLWCLLGAPAVEVEAGTNYEGPRKLKVSAAGVSVFIDKGWTALLPPGAEAIIIQTPGQQGMILATADRADRARVKATLSTSIPVDAGVVLKPRGAVKA